MYGQVELSSPSIYMHSWVSSTFNPIIQQTIGLEGSHPLPVGGKDAHNIDQEDFEGLYRVF